MIEDLGQSIAAIKHATAGKSVFVKVGATNYVPYTASGVSRWEPTESYYVRGRIPQVAIGLQPKRDEVENYLESIREEGQIGEVTMALEGLQTFLWNHCAGFSPMKSPSQCDDSILVSTVRT